MKFLRLLMVLPLVVASPFAACESHNFIQLNYIQERPAAEDAKPSGIGILARFDFSEHFFLRGELEELSDNGVDVNGQELAFAYVFNLDEAIAFHAAAVFAHEDEQHAGEKEHSLAKGIELGFHTELGESFVLHGEAASLYEGGEQTTAVALGLLFKLNQKFGANFELSQDEDKNKAIELGFRYSF